MESQDGGLYFKETLDNKQFLEAAKASTRAIQGHSDAVVAAGEKIQKSYQNLSSESTKYFTSSQKNSKREIGLIADIEKEIEKLKDKKRNAYSIEDIEKYNKKLQEAELNLKEYNNAGRQSVDTGKEHKSVIDNVVGSLGKWAIGLFSVHAALKIGKEIIASTDTTTHAFNLVIGEARAGIDYFFKSIASGDWSNFNKGMDAAIKGAKEFINEQHDIENRKNEQTIKDADILKQIDSLRQGTFDKGVENNDKLIENLTKIIDLEKKDAAEQALIAKDNYESHLKDAAVQSGVNKERLDTLITEYTKNKELIELGEKYNSIKSKLKGGDLTVNPEEIKVEFDKLTKEGGEAAGKVAMEFGKVPMELRKSLAALKADQIKLEGQSQIGSRRDENQLAMAINKREAEEEKSKKALIESADLHKQINDQIELLNKAVADGNTAEIKATAARISILQKELDIRTNIAKAALLSAFTGGKGAVTATDISHLDVSIPFIKPVLPGLQKWNNADNVKQTASDKKANADDEASLEKQRKLRQQIKEEATALIVQLGEMVGLDEKVVAGVGNLLSAFSSGNVIEMAGAVLSNLLSLLPNQAAKFKSQIDQLNLALKEQQHLIEQADKLGGGREAREEILKVLKQEEQMYLKILHDKAAMGKATTEDIDNLRSATFAYEQAVEDYNNFIRGGLESSSIADSLIEAIHAGKTAVDDLAGYLNDSLREAALEAFKSQILIPLINKEFMPKWQEAMSDNFVDPSEKADLMAWAHKVSDTYKPAIDQIFSVFGDAQDLGNIDSLSGSIKGVSEQTASVVAGQMNAMRVTQIDTNGLIRQQLMQLGLIENNTRYCKHLESIDNKLSAGSLRASGLE